MAHQQRVALMFVTEINTTRDDHHHDAEMSQMRARFTPRPRHAHDAGGDHADTDDDPQQQRSTAVKPLHFIHFETLTHGVKGRAHRLMNKNHHEQTDRHPRIRNCPRETPKW